MKRAVRDGEPLLSRITTVTGDAVARPGNYEVRLGTPVVDLLHHAGVDKERLGRLVMGGLDDGLYPARSVGAGESRPATA